MAHYQQEEFCKLINKYFFKEKKITILEIGSYNVNGTIRSIFTNSIKYIGVDVVKGPDVDVVYDGLNLDIKDKFDLSISCECFEHNPYYLENFKNMIDLTNANGIVAFTCASIIRGEHGTTRTSTKDSPGSMEKWDYYKNLFKKDFEEKLNLNELFYKYQFFYNLTSYDLYFIGIKNNNFSIGLELLKKNIALIYSDEISQELISLHTLYIILKKTIKKILRRLNKIKMLFIKKIL